MKRRFTELEVFKIRTAYAQGAGQKQLAFFWDCNRKSIQDIVHGRTYKAVGGPLSKPNRICPECRQLIQATSHERTSLANEHPQVSAADPSR